MSEYKHGRGEFYYKIDNNLITVFLCNPEELGCEAEHIMTVDVAYVPSLLSTLRKGAMPQ